MTKGSFHIHNSAKRRGEGLPARLRIVARRGTTLVELLIAMLILTIVCIAWLEIIGIQSARKEARRREAVERLAGMMDAFMYWSKTGKDPYNNTIGTGNYQFKTNALGKIYFDFDPSSGIHAVFDTSKSPIGYQLSVYEDYEYPYRNLFSDWGGYHYSSWGDWSYWLVGRLYDQNGQDDSRKPPFWVLSVCLGEGLSFE